MAKQSSFMLAWTKALVSKYGPPKSTTRHVLLTLATHMNGDGTSCFPSQKTLAEETCMSHVAIYKHLTIAAGLGWIARWQQKEGGRDWALTYYEATFPHSLPADEFDPPWLVDRNWQKSEGTKRRFPPVASAGTKPDYVPSDAGADGECHVTGRQGTKPDACRHETSADEVRNGIREARNGEQRGRKRRFHEGSSEDSIQGSNVGRAQEGAGASASTRAENGEGEKAREELRKRFALEDRVERAFVEHALADVDLFAKPKPEALAILQKRIRASEGDIESAITTLVAAGRLPIQRRGRRDGVV